MFESCREEGLHPVAARAGQDRPGVERVEHAARAELIPANQIPSVRTRGCGENTK